MMLEELQRRIFSEDTTRHSIRTVEDFARHFNRPPDRLGLRFFYVKTLKKAWSVTETPYPQKNYRLPTILSQKKWRDSSMPRALLSIARC